MNPRAATNDLLPFQGSPFSHLGTSAWLNLCCSILLTRAMKPCQRREWDSNPRQGQKSLRCLDYIILHELTHLVSRKHDATFIAHMDRFMPNWREVRKELNDARLDYYAPQR